jgi:autotransporter-associated beta strand protein
MLYRLQAAQGMLYRLQAAVQPCFGPAEAGTTGLSSGRQDMWQKEKKMNKMTRKTIMSLVMGSMALAAQAATFTWDGGGTDNFWLTDANWNPDGAPASDGTATLAFSGNTRNAAANNYPADTVFAGLTFANDYSANKTAGFTLSGNLITLGGNVVSTAASTAITDTISLGMLLNATRTFTPNTLHHLTVSGVIGETGGSFGLTKTGGGYLTLNGTNTYTGPTTLSGGFVYFNSLKNVGEGASALGAPATAESGTLTTSSRLFYTGPSTSTDRTIVLTGGIQFDVSTGSSTLTLNGNITSVNNQGPTFRSGGNVVVNGVVNIGSAGVTRTDGGTVYLNCPTNPFTGNIQISAGAFSITNIADSGVACTIGKGNTITLGQNGWNTTGKLQFTGTSGGACNRSLRVETTEGSTVHGGILENTVAGQTLRLSGTVAPASASVTRNPRVQLHGAGNGELSGVISGSIIIDKNSGSGSWTLSGANTYTGTTSVSAGTLLINGSTHAASAVSVASGGTLGGTGTVYGAVSVAAGGRLVPGASGVGTLSLANAGAAALSLNGNTITSEISAVAGVCDTIAIAGTLVLNGANTLALAFPAGTAPEGIYTQMTYAARSGGGTLTLDTANPNYRLTVGDTCATLAIGGASRLWKGDGSANVWDTSVENWLDGGAPATYADNTAVVFDNTGSATPAVNIAPDAVAPFSVTVDADANAYTIGGAAITGLGWLAKTGTNVLALTGANTYSGATAVNAGTLTLSGSLSDSSVTVANKATFTQSASGVIAGAGAAFTCLGTATLSGTNSYGGLTTVGVLGVSNILLTVNSPFALGSPAAGTLVNGGSTYIENRLVLGSGVTVADETLTLAGGASSRVGLHYLQYGGTGAWHGDIVLASGPCYLTCDNAGGTLVIGATPGHTITGSPASLSLRGLGSLAVNSTINIGTAGLMRDDIGVATLHAAGNILGDTSLLEGTLRLGVSDALPSNRTLTLGKSGNTAHATFDLNGMSQTVAGLADQRFAAGTGTQRIISAAPATLTVSNATANAFGLTGSSIEGAVSLVKRGNGTLTLTGTNTTSGSFIVSNGTLAVSSAGTFGVNSTNIVVAAGTLTLQNSQTLADTATLSIAEGGAKVSLAAGVNETVGSLFLGGVQKRVGTYGSTDSSAAVKDDAHFAGPGILTVLHDKSGTLFKIQ